ncbi:hypothetical protein PIB30_074409 [Stylosanthes scabra]|uniref:Uncharacterized protein n=1 Tax=Stylosanthes scabra TaxID=79078 RepID=A0ABU6SQY7_9FABA|nr:hypothetical protein [Stylosanthes scabra]
MSYSSDLHDAHYFRSQFHQDLFEEHMASNSVTPETSFDLQEDEYPEIQEQIAKRGWRRLSKPRTKISKVLIQGFYANTVRTKEEIASGEGKLEKGRLRSKKGRIWSILSEPPRLGVDTHA